MNLSPSNPIDTVRVCIIGAKNSGKTSIFQYLRGKDYLGSYSPTKGADKGFRYVRLYNNKKKKEKGKIMVSITDSTSHDRFSTTRSLIIKVSHMAVIVLGLCPDSSHSHSFFYGRRNKR